MRGIGSWTSRFFIYVYAKYFINCNSKFSITVGELVSLNETRLYYLYNVNYICFYSSFCEVSFKI